MATFPALNPAARVYTPPTDPFQGFSSSNGLYDGVLLCNSPRDARVELFFKAISTADKDAIVTHYDGQESGFIAFDLPNDIFSGVTAGDYITAGYLWRYDAPPEITDISSAQSGGCVLVHDVSLTLVSEVAALMFVAGADLRLGLSLAPGVAIGNAPPAALTLSLSLTPGTFSGAALSLSLSLSAGAASGS